MAGEAKTSAFMLASATVMIGPVADLFNLNPSDHSIGLCKNFQISAEPTYTDLTQGVQNTIVYSTLTGNPIRASCEVYEYNSRTLSYALGLEAPATSDYTALTLKTALTSGGTSVVADAAVDPNIAQDDWIIIQRGNAGDLVHVGQAASAGIFSTDQVTITLTAGTAVDTDNDFSVGDRVTKVNRIDVGSKTSQPYFAAKVVCPLPEGGQPIILLLPKVRITKGFTVGSTTDNFGNMPYELTPYDLVATDTFYSLFQGKGSVALFSDF